MAIPSTPVSVGFQLTGKTSWFGGPNDPSDSGSTASGIPESTPGIAVYNQATLKKYWRVKFPNGKTLDLQQTDLGPAPFTGRVVDVLYSALGAAGYTEGNFPTDGSVTATFLGDKPGGLTPVASGGVAGLGGTGIQANPQYPFQIGSTSNPQEDCWTGINRIAQDVGWYLFSDAETVYYIDGADLIQQDPGENALIDRFRNSDRIQNLTIHYDDTAYAYQSAHKRKGKVQRKSRLAMVNSPTECNLALICGIDEFRAGDIIVLSSCGPANGRWVIADVRRSVFAVFSSLRLVPPIMPLSEAQAAGTTGTTGSIEDALSGQISGDARSKVVQVAQKAIARQAASGAYHYAEVRPYPTSLFGAAPVVTDCSGFAILCYKEAGQPDPNGTGFDGNGFTGSLLAKGTPVTNPQPGDLCFYYGGGHVAVFLGNGQIANMGSEGEPVAESISAPGGYPYTCRSYL